MRDRSSIWSIVLAIGLAVTVLAWTPNCALAGDSEPAYKLPGPRCVWAFFDWLLQSGDDGSDSSGSDDGGEEDEGERLFDEYFGPW